MFNVAHAGATSADFRVSTHYRSQWASIANPYVSPSVCMDIKAEKKNCGNTHFGIGLVFLFIWLMEDLLMDNI